MNDSTMKTKIVNLKQFRQKITSLWKESRKDNIRYIVMFHSTPILEVTPYTGDLLDSESLKKIKNDKELKKSANIEKKEVKNIKKETNSAQFAENDIKDLDFWEKEDENLFL